jgi:hypothetical protein
MQPSARPRLDPSIPNPKPGPGATQPAARRSLFRGLFGLGAQESAKPAIPEDPNENALLAFPSETTARPEPIALVEAPAAPARRPRQPGRSPWFRGLLLVALGAAALIVAAVLVFQRLPSSHAGAAESVGSLTIDTRLVTAEVLIDGQVRGVTPLKLSLPAGAHTVTVRTDGDERVVPLTIAAGADVTQYFELKSVPAASLVGQMSIAADAPDARIMVDGRAQGAAPITVGGLTPGDHKVTVTTASGTTERIVNIVAGTTASVVFSGSKSAGPVGGWLSISSPFEVQVAENDDVIGTSGASRIMLATGHHNVTLVNRALGYQDVRKIEVTPGKTVSLRVDPPKVSVSVNARPWADIVLDGTNVGQTPIANLAVTVGSHEMLFRHPQYGERKEAVLVTVKGPNRIAVDFTK